MKTLIEKEAGHAKARKMDEADWLLPAVNVFELKDSFVIEAEMPGVGREGLDITLEGHTLALAGRRELHSPGGAPLYVESKPAGFRRVFEVDPTLDTGKIEAHLEQGLLTVRLPKAERAKPRRILVTE
jgi:HSP20 family protein